MHCKSSCGNHDNIYGSTSHGNLMKLTKVTFNKKASKPTLALTVEILWYHARAYCWTGLGNILRDIDIVIENVPTHALANEEISFTRTLKVSSGTK